MGAPGYFPNSEFLIPNSSVGYGHPALQPPAQGDKRAAGEQTSAACGVAQGTARPARRLVIGLGRGLGQGPVLLHPQFGVIKIRVHVTFPMWRGILIPRLHPLTFPMWRRILIPHLRPWRGILIPHLRS